MNFSYSGNPNASKSDKLRFLIQDTDPNDPLLSDNEILFLIDAFGDVESAAIEACYILIAKYSRYVDETEGKLSIKASQIQSNYKTLAKELENKYIAGCTIFFGGISANEYEKNINNKEINRTQFSDRNGDNPRAWRGNDN